MKLALVRQHYRPDGGAERFVSRALDALAHVKSLSVSVITRGWESHDAPAYEVITCNPPIKGRIQREQAFASEAIKHFAQFDIVQSHERIPGCHIYRSGDGVHEEWLHQRSRILSPLKRAFLWRSRFHRYVMAQEKAMYQHPALKAVICNSRMVADEIKRYFDLPEEKIALIYNGVNTEVFHPSVRDEHREAIRTQLAIPADAPVMIFVGSGFERKGLDGALNAIRHEADVHLLVVGKDKNPRRYARLCRRYGIEGRVHFVGMQKDTRPWYGAADMLLLPTLYDPFPNVILEAMACGLGVITSTKCGGQEFIEEGKNGFVRDALDMPGLQQAVTQARKAGFEPLGRSARESVLPWNLETLSQNMVALYSRLI